MADFDIPFSEDGERRDPTPTEQSLGIQCGAGQRTLFNQLFHHIQAELGHLIGYAGLVGDDEDLTQVRQAVEALIAAATGGGDTSQFLLMAQARARLPIFPEIVNSTGTMGVTTPMAGQVRVPNGVTFQHRGVFQVTTTQTDLATDPSKIYHLRWNPTDGFQLKDLASPAYNPAVSAESDSKFDSTYDDMLVARVVTNSSNVVTVTNLVNKDRHSVVAMKGTMELGPSWSGLPKLTAAINLSRTPRLAIRAASAEATIQTESIVSQYVTGDRYSLEGFVAGYITTVPAPTNSYISGSMTVEASI